MERKIRTPNLRAIEREDRMRKVPFETGEKMRTKGEYEVKINEKPRGVFGE